MKRAATLLLVILMSAFAAPAMSFSCDPPVDNQRFTCMYLYQSRDYEPAMECCFEAASSGDQVSQMFLGFMHYRGLGTEQDFEAAAKWLRQSAKGGNVRAMVRLGTMYRDGKGVPQNFKNAEEWFGKAALVEGNGYAEPQHYAQYHLGMMYKDGLGVRQDFKKAKEWLAKAALKRVQEAQAAVAEIYYLERNSIKAMMWYEISLAMAAHKALKSVEKPSPSRIRENLRFMQGQGNESAKFKSDKERKEFEALDREHARKQIKVEMAEIDRVIAEGGDFRDLIALNMSKAQIAQARKLALQCVNSYFENCQE